MNVQFSFCGKPSHLQLHLVLLALLDQVSAAVDDLGFDQPLLIKLAGPLYNFDQGVD